MAIAADIAVSLLICESPLLKQLIAGSSPHRRYDWRAANRRVALFGLRPPNLLFVKQKPPPATMHAGAPRLNRKRV
jgi:hypothetical protein